MHSDLNKFITNLVPRRIFSLYNLKLTMLDFVQILTCILIFSHFISTAKNVLMNLRTSNTCVHGILSEASVTVILWSSGGIAVGTWIFSTRCCKIFVWSYYQFLFLEKVSSANPSVNKVCMNQVIVSCCTWQEWSM